MNRDECVREIERGIIIQVTPELSASSIWRRVREAARLEGRSVTALVANGIMCDLEGAEDDLRDQRGLN